MNITLQLKVKLFVDSFTFEQEAGKNLLDGLSIFEEPEYKIIEI